MTESVKAFGIGAVGVLLSYSLIAVYVLNTWLVHFRGRGAFRSLMVGEVILVALGSFGARLGLGTAGETLSPNRGAVCGAVFGLAIGLLLPLYTPFDSFLTDCLWGILAILLGAALSRIAILMIPRTE